MITNNMILQFRLTVDDSQPKNIQSLFLFTPLDKRIESTMTNINEIDDWR